MEAPLLAEAGEGLTCSGLDFLRRKPAMLVKLYRQESEVRRSRQEERRELRRPTLHEMGDVKLHTFRRDCHSVADRAVRVIFAPLLVLLLF